MEANKFISINKQRTAKLEAEFNPLTGLGSQVPRQKIDIIEYNKLGAVYLPESMFEDEFIQLVESTNSVIQAGKQTNLEEAEAWDKFYNLRLDHDFEFWALVCAKIKPKGGGADIPFVLNGPQRKLLGKLEELRRAGVPIRIVLLKARQWGGSTLVQIYMSWIQSRHKTNWNSLIAAHLNQAANNIRGMYRKLVTKYPQDVQQLSWAGFENQTNVKIIPERQCKVTVGSMQSPESIRSEDVAMFHASEIGLWRKTEGKRPEDLIQAVIGTIPSMPLTIVVYESTAKGVGNFFHRSWQNAVSGNNNFEPVFVAWFEIEMYRTAFVDADERLKFIKSLDSYEMKLWNFGATLEGIKWYREKLKEMEGDHWRMKSEFPSTAQEAFQSTGRRVFPPSYTAKARENCCKPLFKGDIFGNSDKGHEALKSLRLDETPGGNLSVWLRPNDPPPPAGHVITNRYAIFVDIGGTSKGADYSVISGFDRYLMTKADGFERAFTWRGHIDLDLLAWKAAQLGSIYNNALLAFETNSIDKDKNAEGQNGLTILDELKDHYDNLYRRIVKENVKEIQNKYGFHTNTQTKGMIKDNYTALLRERGYYEYDQRAIDEADTYEVKDNGSLGAVEGQHDDVLMTTMGGTWLSSSYMEAPRVVKLSTGRGRSGRTKTMSSF